MAETVARRLDLPAWPEGQAIKPLDPQRIVLRTRFEDVEAYHPALTARILELAEAAEAAGQRGRSMGGTKLYGLHEWNCPEADLIEARAAAFFRQARGAAEAFIDVSWANVYQAGDYIMPHSHTRTAASLVYMLAPGDPDPEDPDAGCFAIVDPRYEPCCQAEKGHMTNPVRLKLRPGGMLLFPGQLVHCVNPYRGASPRITLAWNINPTPLVGSMLGAAKGQKRG